MATYDHQNLPLSLTSNGVASSYRYDGSGQRIAKQVAGGNTELYVLDGPTTLGVITVNGSGAPISWYLNVLAGDRVVGRQPNAGNRKYYHADLLGTTRAVVEGTGVVESYDPEPWGLLMPGRTLGSGTKEIFTGKERDVESGLDYFGARLYMPALGRWGSVDPMAGKYPQWSAYSYTLDNPVSSIDPTGRDTEVLNGAEAQEFFRVLQARLGRKRTDDGRGSSLIVSSNGTPCPPCISNDLNPRNLELEVEFSRRIFPETMMALGELVRGGSVKATIAEHEEVIADAAAANGVDAALMKSIIYEEQTHQLPFEAVLEARGHGRTVGLGQMTVGSFGTREELLDPATNIKAMAAHLSALQAQGLIDPTRPAASLATKYNCGSCSSISPYGERVERFRAQFPAPNQ
jgi:RHS repeat-associated protein